MSTTPVSSATLKKIEALGALIRELRQMRGWRQDDLAEKARVNQYTITQVERAVQNPSAHVLIKIAEAFGFRLSDLLDEVDL